MISYHGIDLHSSNLICNTIKKENGNLLKRENKKVYINEIKSKFIPYLTKEDSVCVEASTGTFAFAKLIKPHVKDVFVINPFDFRALYMSEKKTDKIDAKKLANKLKYHLEANDPDDGFPIVNIPSDTIVELRSLFTTYKIYNKQRTGLKNRIHSIIKQNLIMYNSDTLFCNLEEIINKNEIRECDKEIIKMLYEDIKQKEQRIFIIKEKIVLLTYKNYEKELKIIMAPSGISTFTACAIIADYGGNIEKFKNSKKFTAYLRSAPRVDSSGDTVHNGKTRKKGRKLAFSLVVQGLHHLIKSNPYFFDFYEKKTKGKSKGKVRSALVRKSFVSIYYMLKNQKTYKYIKKELYQNKIKALDKFIQQKYK